MRAVQGHSERILEAFGIDQDFELITADDPDLPSVAYHGTTPDSAEEILTVGFRTRTGKHRSRRYAYVADKVQNCVKPGSGNTSKESLPVWC